MNAIIIDGKVIADKLLDKVAQKTKDLKNNHNIVPGLGVIIAGENPASKTYVASKRKRAAELGFISKEISLSSEINMHDILRAVDKFNKDDDIHGFLVQLPLPSKIDPLIIADAISPLKDVDGFGSQNAGSLFLGKKTFYHKPCTPKGCMILLNHCVDSLSGLKAIVIGRSNIVGKPMAQMLLGSNCTVLCTHSNTRDLAKECSSCDIVISAVGKPELVNQEWIKKGAIVIDVGIKRTDSGLKGDVDFNSVRKKAGFLTPVPGGVGPMTVACLMLNVIQAAYASVNEYFLDPEL